MIGELAAPIIAKNDDAIKATAGDADPPSQSDLAAWAGHCPPLVLTEVEARLAVMWRLKPQQVRVTRLGFVGRAYNAEGWSRALRDGPRVGGRSDAAGDSESPLSACEHLPPAGGQKGKPSTRPNSDGEAGDGRPGAQAGWASLQPRRASARPAGTAGLRVRVGGH